MSLGRSSFLIAATVVVLFQPVTAQDAAAPSPAAPERPAYVTRGDEVEARYEAYRERLQRFFETFCAVLAAQAPDLLAKLREAPPAPVPYGYGILPKLVPDPPLSSRPVRNASTSFSWRRTDGFVDRDTARVERMEARLRNTGEVRQEERRREWTKLVDEYRTLAADQKLIASHIEYNRLWQREIARNRAVYDERTALHDAVLERQGLLEALAAGDEILAPSLQARVDALSARILETTHSLSPPTFLRVERPAPEHVVLRMAVYTDIEDPAFLDAFRSAVEKAWHVRDGEADFAVVVEICHVAVGQLYPRAEPPRPGAHLEQWRHVDRFPPDGSVLTTGSNTTYVLGRAINVGPHDIGPTTLAHEFGHLLGFADGYLRGYRDRGKEGFEVLEVLPDTDDIMSQPGNGRVNRDHFQRLLEKREGR